MAKKSANFTKTLQNKVILVVLAIALVAGGAAAFTGKSLTQPTVVRAENSVALTANTAGTGTLAETEGDGDTTGTGDAADTDTSEDAGEVQKGDIVDFSLTAKFSAGSGDLSGLVTFTDVLPEHMELVTGSQTVNGATVDCTPSLSGVSGAKWAMSETTTGAGSAEAGDFTYDTATRTLKCYIKDMEGAGDALSEASIKIYVKVTDDAYSLTPQVKLLYYTNYATVNYAQATSVSNKVRFFSGYSDAGEYTIHYAWTGATGEGEENEPPKGVEVPEDTKYLKSEETPAQAVTIAPKMEHQGYKFEGWSISTDSAIEGVTLTEEGLVWPNTVNGTEITLVGKWTKVTDTFKVENTWIGWDSATAAVSPNDRPQLTDITGDKATELVVGSAVTIPQFPSTTATSSDDADANDTYASLYDAYTFLGFDIFATYSDGTKVTCTPTAAEVENGQFVPAQTNGTAALTKVTVQGKWERKSFTMYFAKGDGWPNSVELTDFPGIAGGQSTDDGTNYMVTMKWGEKVVIPTAKEVEGAIFRSWFFEPEMQELTAAKTDASATYTMPKEDVVVRGDWDEAYTLTTVNATFGLAGEAAGKTTKQVIAGSFVTVTPSEVGDVKFVDYTCTDGQPADVLTEWTQSADNTATFVMPEKNVTLTANMALIVTLNIKNGKWASGESSALECKVPVTKNPDDNTWSGTLTTEKVTTTVGDLSAATPNESYDPDSRHWENETAGTTEFPAAYLSDGYFTADANGKFDTSKKREFTFQFDLLTNITVTYKVFAMSDGMGKVGLKTTDGSDPVYSTEVTSAAFDPSSDAANAAGTAIAKPEDTYAFVRWATEDYAIESVCDTAEFSPAKELTESGDTIYVARTYVAVFEKCAYQIKFNANGGTGAMENQTFICDEAGNLSANTFTRDGYVFAGWNTKADGSGDVYADEQQIEKLSMTNGDVINLYAQWRHNGKTNVVDDVCVFANDITITIQEAQALLAKDEAGQLAEAIERSKAFAIQKDDANKTTNKINVTQADLSSVKAMFGDYPATLSTDNGSSVSIVVHVVYAADDYIEIKAHTFRISIAEAEALLNGEVLDSDEITRLAGTSNLNDAQEEMVRLASAVAARKLCGDVCDIKKVTTTIKAKKAEDFSVTFEGEENAKTTINNVVVADNSSESAKLKTRMTSNNIELTFAEAGELLAKSNTAIADELTEKCDAYAYFTDTGAETDVTETEWDIKQKEGTYTATFYTAEEAKVTSTVKVGPEETTAAAATTATGKGSASTLAKTGDAAMWAAAILLLIALISVFAVKFSKERAVAEGLTGEKELKKKENSRPKFQANFAKPKRSAVITTCILCAAIACSLTAFASFDSAKADVADVEFDAVSISQGARLHLNGDQSVTAISGGKVFANQTNGEEVESAEASALLPSFISDHYGQDGLGTFLSNASFITADLFKANQKYLPAADNSFWLADESSTYGVPIQAWRTATNGTESLTKAAQGKSPNGILFTPAPEYASFDMYDYMLNYPKKSISMNGYDVKTATQFEDCSWPATTKVWSLDSTAKQTCWQHDTTLTRTIYDGKEVYNNPWCIEDHSRGFYKTTAKCEYFNNNLVEGRVEIFEGSDTAEPAAFFHTRATMYGPIEVGDVLFLSVNDYYLRDTTGFLKDYDTRVKQTLFNIYFKAEEKGQIKGFNIYYAPNAIGVYDATQETDAVKGQLLDAGKHALRPAIDFDSSKVVFFRDSTSTTDLAVSTQLGSTPRASAGNGNNLKTVLSSDEQKISFDVKASNCSTDRDAGRNKITTVKNSTVIVPWKSTELTLDNVGVTNASYVSALVQKDTNKKYAVLAKAEDGQVKIDLTNLVQWVGDKVTISLYAEQPSDAGWSDFISAEPVTFEVEMAAASPQKIVYDINGGQGTKPADTVANAGEQVNLADGSKLVSATGNAFSRWEVTYTPYGETEPVTTMMHSQELMVMPDVTGDGTTGVITAKAIYAGGMKAAKSTDYVASQTITFDSNAPAGTTATVDGTKTTLEVQSAFGQPLGSSTIPADSGLTCTATDGSIWVFGGWSQTKTDTIENSMTNAELTAEQVVVNAPMTFYAIWMKTNGFWLGTKEADETFFNEAQFKKNDDNYDTSTNILADMQILHNSGNTKYGTTKTKWEGYCTGDNIRLYSTYSGGTGLNSMVEFRVIEVSGATGHDADGSAVTFMASTSLPKDYPIYNSTRSNSLGGWRDSDIRTSMNSGEIYNYFPTNLTNNIKSVTKKYCEGYPTTQFDISNRTKYATCADKMWLISYVEANGQPTQDPKSFYGAPPTAEGVQYSWCKSNSVGANILTKRGGKVIYNSMAFTRSPGYIYNEGMGLWWPSMWWLLGSLSYTDGLSIAPCFCF